MDNVSISIVIPCYDCEQTLEEALLSVYRQNLDSFEVIMVDDGSSDGTRDLIKKLAAKHPNISCIFHEKNMGGGAARNTGVRRSKGRYVFCLDSDDILGDGTLSKMVALADEKKCDGVGISTSIKFKGKNIKDVAFVNDFDFAGGVIPFESLIEKGNPNCPLYSVFLFTREAFDIIGGFPTDHGFDTQGLAWRFLANGLKAYGCPDTTYFHRINFSRSYYVREYESGKVNHNWFKVLDEFIYLFDEKSKEMILGFDFNDPTKLLIDRLKSESNIFIPDYRRLLKPKIKDALLSELESKKERDKFEDYWLGSEYLRRGRPSDAAKPLSDCISSGLAYPMVYYKLSSTGVKSRILDDKETADKISKLFEYKKQGRQAPMLVRVFRKIIRTFNL